jgi:hypothetical protein
MRINRTFPKVFLLDTSHKLYTGYTQVIHRAHGVCPFCPSLLCEVHYTLAKCPESPDSRFENVSWFVYNSGYKKVRETL